VTPEQARAAEEFRRLRGVDPFGPFIPLLKSPELMLRAGALGEYLRYRSALPPRLSEFVILITAAEWQQSFEWEIHAPLALKAGTAQEVLDDLWAGQAPDGLAADQQALYELCTTLHRDRRVPQAVVKKAEDLVGEQAVIDAIGICGYYAFLAMILNSR
jgi:4-carboxymuconolactone decarboxylase